MQCSVALLVIAAVICFGNCKIPSKEIFNGLFRRVDFKRQASDIDQCVNDRLEAASADEGCMVGIDIINNNETFCRPNCKDLILRAIDECGGFRDYPGLRKFYSGLCDKNMNGEPCYSFFNRGINYVGHTENFCFFDLVVNNTCTCRSELMTEVQVQGCCINVYQDYLEAVLPANYSYNTNVIYEGCNVDQIEECSSMAPVSTLVIIIISFMLQTIITY